MRKAIVEMERWEQNESVCFCAVCFEDFGDCKLERRPRLLRCGHSFCVQCLGLLSLKASSGQASLQSGSSAAASSGTIECPKCRQLTPLSSAGVDGLPCNFDLLEIIRFQKKEEKADTVIGHQQQTDGDPETCGDCKRARAAKYCEQCGGYLCTSCDEQLHSRALLRSHKRVPKGEAPVPCQTHRDKKLEYWCSQDKQAVCTACLLIGGHKGHNMTSLEEAAKGMKTEAQTRLNALEAAILNVDKAMAQIRGIEADAHRRAEETRAAIGQHFQQLTSALLRREIELEAQVKEWEEKMVQESRTKSEQLAQVMMQLKTARGNMAAITESTSLRSVSILLANGNASSMQTAANQVCSLVGPSLLNIPKTVIAFQAGETRTLLDNLTSCGSLQFLMDNSASQISLIVEEARKFVQANWSSGTIIRIEENPGLHRGCPAMQRFVEGVRRLGGASALKSAFYAWRAANDEDSLPSVCHNGFDPVQHPYFGRTSERSRSYCRGNRMFVALLLRAPETTVYSDHCTVYNPRDLSAAYSLPVLVITFGKDVGPVSFILESPRPVSFDHIRVNFTK